MASKLVSLRVSDELLIKLESDMVEGESLGSTIQRILNHHYALALDSTKVDRIQELVADEVEKRTANLTAGYYDLKNQLEGLQAEVSKIQTSKTTRKKPLTN